MVRASGKSDMKRTSMMRMPKVIETDQKNVKKYVDRKDHFSFLNIDF